MINLGLRGMRWQAHSLLNSSEYAEEAHNCYRRHFGLVPLRRGARSDRLPTTDMTPFRTLYLHDDVLLGTFDNRDFVSSPIIGEIANRVYFIEGDTLQYLPKNQINAGYPTDTTTLGHAAALPIPPLRSATIDGVELTYGAGVNGGENFLTDANEEATFLYTYVDQYGAESEPSVPTLSMFYERGVTRVNMTIGYEELNPDVVGIRVYQAISGRFFQVGSPLVEIPEDLVTGTPRITRINRLLTMDQLNATPFIYSFIYSPETALDPLITLGWAPPPSGIKHLLKLDNGMVVMASDNTIHFNEPYHMHAWPVAYDRSVEGTIIAMEKTSAGFVVVTNREAHFFMGNTPEGMQETTRVFRYPIHDPDSMCILDEGVIYFCNEGIALVTANGGRIITDTWIDREAFRDHVTVTEVKCEMYEGRVLAATRNPQNGNPIGYIFNLADQDVTSFDMSESSMQLGFWRDPENNDVCYADDLAGLAVFNRGDRLVSIYETGDIVVPRAANLCVAHVDAEEYPAEPNAIKITIKPEGKANNEVIVRSHRPTRLKPSGRARKIRVRLESGKTLTRVMLTMDARQT